MKKRAMHKDVWVKVNCQVDEGVVPLVNAINAIPGMASFDSCQEHSTDRMAHVKFYFESLNNVDGLYRWVRRIAEHLRGKSDLRRDTWEVSLNWWWGNRLAFGNVRTRPDCMADVAAMIEELALEQAEEG